MLLVNDSPWHAVSALNIFPAVGIAAFGTAVCSAAHLPWHPAWILWLAGGILVYNVDRFVADAADWENTPLRHRYRTRYRSTRLLVIGGSGAVLFVAPLLLGTPLLAGIIVLGTLLCVNYSVVLPPFRRRIKSLPLVKSFFPPLAITVALFVIPLLLGRQRPDLSTLLIALWTYMVLLTNVLLCDLRDIGGDRRTGVVSLPVRLGSQRTRRCLYGLILASMAPCLLLWLIRPVVLTTVTAVIVAAYFAAVLAWRPTDTAPEWYYEWLVDGFLYIPALALATTSY